MQPMGGTDLTGAASELWTWRPQSKSTERKGTLATVCHCHVLVVYGVVSERQSREAWPAGRGSEAYRAGRSLPSVRGSSQSTVRRSI